MNVQIRYSERAKNQLLDLERKTAQKIVRKIRFYAESNEPLEHAKPLKGMLEGRYRYRIGNYRAIFECDDKEELVVITILIVKHRKDIYKK